MRNTRWIWLLNRRSTSLVAFGLLILAGCAYPTRNQPATELYHVPGTNLVQIHDTLVIVTASGGGARATALTLATLRALASVSLPSGDTLADHIDVLSSVSGGSVAAATFALAGTAGLDRLESDFLAHDVMSDIVHQGLNPVELAKLSTPHTERIDLLINYLDDALFHGATFADLPRGPSHPYLILNAADMVSGVPFSFTGSTFDLICSDLPHFKLATAVAASAAFPVALSAVTLKNYSPCAVQQAEHPWPPLWVENDATSDWYDNPARVMRGRVALAYALGNQAPQGIDQKRYIHLLDGGIADNLGVAEPLHLLTSADVSPSLFNRVSQGQVKRIVWIVINARNAPSSDLDGAPNTPGIIDMFLGSVDTAIDSRTAANISLLQDTLRSEFVAAAAEMPPPLNENFARVANHLYVIPVDFDAISDPACRHAFHSIPTSWTLSQQQRDGLALVGPALLGQAARFSYVLRELSAMWRKPPPTLLQVCSKIEGSK